MKKQMAVLLVLLLLCTFAACARGIEASQLYAFPEPTWQITGTLYSAGQEHPFMIGCEEYDSNDLSALPVISWFYGLKLRRCDPPEAVEGAEVYCFEAKGEEAFCYENRGDSAYIIVEGTYYRVKNPSVPPIAESCYAQ